LTREQGYECCIQMATRAFIATSRHVQKRCLICNVVFHMTCRYLRRRDQIKRTFDNHIIMIAQ
jgi:hypothetical protein